MMPVPHMIWAAAGCLALVGWPALARGAGPSAPGPRPAIAVGAAAILLALLAWFATELIAYGGQAGLAERVFGIAQGLWPLVVVISCRRAAASRIPGLTQQAARPALESAAGD